MVIRSIARQLVMAQATLSRCFRRLAELGCIEVAGYTVIVRDAAALRSLAGEPPPLVATAAGRRRRAGSCQAPTRSFHCSMTAGMCLALP